MKVGIVNTLYSPDGDGGAERSVQSLAESLAACGAEVFIIRSGPKSLRYERNDVRIVTLKVANLYWPFAGQRGKAMLTPLWHLIDSYNRWTRAALRPVLQQEAPDLIHTNVLAGLSVAVWSEAKAQGLPIVHTLRDYYLLCPRSTMFNNGRNCGQPCTICRLYSLVRNVASKHVDHVVGISDFVLQRHLSAGFFPRASWSVIPNGYDKVAKRMAAPHRNDRLRLGYLGRLAPTKGVEGLIDAAKALRPGSRQVSLQIAGLGEATYVNALRERAQGADVTFLGFRKPEEFFPEIDVLVVPSIYHEPLGRVVIEAYAHGIPVIAARRGGLPEIVEENRTGTLFDPDDGASLLSAIGRVGGWFEAKDGSDTARREDCLRKSTEFLTGAIASRYMQVYRSLLEKQVRE